MSKFPRFLALLFLVPMTAFSEEALVEELTACCVKKGYTSIEECDKHREVAQACLDAASSASVEVAPNPAAVPEDSSRLRSFGSPEMEAILQQTEGLKKYRVKTKGKDGTLKN